MKKEDAYICILDCYFEPINKDLSYYKISDKELTRLVAEVRSLELEKDIMKGRYEIYIKRYVERIKKLEHDKHVYKIELGRCVRKLTRIYKRIYEVCVIGNIFGSLDIKPKDCVDIYKRM